MKLRYFTYGFFGEFVEIEPDVAVGPQFYKSLDGRLGFSFEEDGTLTSIIDIRRIIFADFSNREE